MKAIRRTRTVRQLLHRLHHTRRTLFKARVDLIQFRSNAYTGFFQTPSSEAGASTDGSTQASTSSGCTAQPKCASANGQVPSVERKSLSEEIQSRTSRKSGKESSSSSGPGPSHRFTSRKVKPQATEKKEPLLNATVKSEAEKKNPSSRSHQEPEENLESLSQTSHYFTASSQNSQTSNERNSLVSQCTREDTDEQNFIVNVPEFNLKYQITDGLASGGYGVIYCGFRKKDNFPVAIKLASKSRMSWVNMMENGACTTVPLEVAMLMRVGAGPEAEDCSITPLLLDWYEVDTDIVMVLERPEPCMDLVDHVNSLGRLMDEAEAKIIFKQLVDGAIEMMSLGVFHRDIKPDNVLIETGKDIPRARFIDFGLGTIFEPDQIFKKSSGTKCYAAPEWYRGQGYQAGPTTVWQLGLTLYCTLHHKRPYASADTVASTWEPRVRADLSDSCKDLLKRLMDKNPQTRISIDDLRCHPWME